MGCRRRSIYHQLNAPPRLGPARIKTIRKRAATPAVTVTVREQDQNNALIRYASCNFTRAGKTLLRSTGKNTPLTKNRESARLFVRANAEATRVDRRAARSE